ncbi:unnamed protein product, partial [Owenia fusiformis]
MYKWASKGWVGVKKVERWKLLFKSIRENNINIKWTHVRGHSGIHGNEQADQLAKRGLAKNTNTQCENNEKNNSITPSPSCPYCKELDNDYMIQCNKCIKWIHYVCTKLPAYEIAQYKTKVRRQYVCEACCADNDDNDEIKLILKNAENTKANTNEVNM